MRIETSLNFFLLLVHCSIIVVRLSSFTNSQHKKHTTLSEVLSNNSQQKIKSRCSEMWAWLIAKAKWAFLEPKSVGLNISIYLIHTHDFFYFYYYYCMCLLKSWIINIFINNYLQHFYHSRDINCAQHFSVLTSHDLCVARG